jgi:hypothetical protein
VRISMAWSGAALTADNPSSAGRTGGYRSAGDLSGGNLIDVNQSGAGRAALGLRRIKRAGKGIGNPAPDNGEPPHAKNCLANGRRHAKLPLSRGSVRLLLCAPHDSTPVWSLHARSLAMDEKYEGLGHDSLVAVLRSDKGSLAGEDLSGADLRGANLGGADLSGAMLVHADLSCANLSGANLGGANLTGASLCFANLSGANLRGANLTNANISGAGLSSADMTDANLTDVERGGPDRRHADRRKTERRQEIGTNPKGEDRRHLHRRQADRRHTGGKDSPDGGIS